MSGNGLQGLGWVTRDNELAAETFGSESLMRAKCECFERGFFLRYLQ